LKSESASFIAFDRPKKMALRNRMIGIAATRIVISLYTTDAHPLASGGGPRCAANRRGTPGVGVIIAPAGQLKDANNVARPVVAASSAIVGSPSFCPGTSPSLHRSASSPDLCRQFGGQSLGNFLRLARVGIDFLSDPAQGRLVQVDLKRVIELGKLRPQHLINEAFRRGPFQFCSC
jgi:hypothetical protein